MRGGGYIEVELLFLYVCFNTNFANCLASGMRAINNE